MSDDPQLEDVREWYIAGRRTHNPFASDAALVERFDTWRADHDREVAARTLRDAAKSMPNGVGETYNPQRTDYDQQRREAAARRAWLRARADQIEKGEG